MSRAWLVPRGGVALGASVPPDRVPPGGDVLPDVDAEVGVRPSNSGLSWLGALSNLIG